MGFDIAEFRTDSDKELEGVWIYFDDEENAGALIARAFNENFNKQFRKLPRGLQHRANAQTLKPGDDIKVWSKLLAATILLDWKNFTYDGKPIKYTKEVAAKILADEPNFRDFIWRTANEEHLYHKEEKEVDVKNSQPSSS